MFLPSHKYHHFVCRWFYRAIEQLFDEKRRGLLTLSTIHKAKGLEWPTVFILDARTLMPSKWAQLPWQKVQERNLQYVAVTRAKLNCFYITSNCWRSVEAAAPPSLSCDPSADDAYLSDCCGAPFFDPGFPDNDMCSECKEHSEPAKD